RTLSCVPLLPPASTSTLFPYTTLFRSLPPPGFEFLPDSTRARDECDEIDLVLETYTQSTATIGLAIRDDATHPLQTQGQTLLNGDRKSTRLNSSHRTTSYAVFCSNKKT